MFNREAFGILLDKVPTLASPWGILLTMLYTAFLALLCILFFSMIDALSWYTPLISQLIMALITVVISYAHFKVLDRYRKRYESMAYQYFFYHWMLPYLVAWYASYYSYPLPRFISSAQASIWRRTD